MNGSTNTFYRIKPIEGISIATYDAKRSAGSATAATTGEHTQNPSGCFANRVSIGEQPAIMDARMRLGDWEVDPIIGIERHQAIFSLTERKSRLALLRKVERKTAQAIAVGVIDLLKPLSGGPHTLTADNGK